MKSTIMKLLAGASLLSVSALGAIPASASTTLTNGNFAGPATVPYETLFASGHGANSTAIPGWTVTSGSVDWINGYWSVPASWPAGSLSIDMNGNGPGAIQSAPFTTVPGAKYVVQFMMSGNSDKGCPAATPTTKSLTVSATNGTTQPFSTTDHVYPAYMGIAWTSQSTWAVETYTFTAGSSTQLTFTADTSNTSPCGPVIADVSVKELLASSGAQCKDFGWQTYSNPGTDVPFMNQGQCVSYFATNHDVPIGSLNSSGLS